MLYALTRFDVRRPGVKYALGRGLARVGRGVRRAVTSPTAAAAYLVNDAALWGRYAGAVRDGTLAFDNSAFLPSGVGVAFGLAAYTALVGPWAVGRLVRAWRGTPAPAEAPVWVAEAKAIHEARLATQRDMTAAGVVSRVEVVNGQVSVTRTPDPAAPTALTDRGLFEESLLARVRAGWGLDPRVSRRADGAVLLHLSVNPAERRRLAALAARVGAPVPQETLPDTTATPSGLARVCLVLDAGARERFHAIPNLGEVTA